MRLTLVPLAILLSAAAPSCDAVNGEAPDKVVDTFLKCGALGIDTAVQSVNHYDPTGSLSATTRDGVRIRAPASMCAVIEVTQKKIDLVKEEEKNAAALEQAKAAAKAEIEKKAAEAAVEPKKGK